MKPQYVGILLNSSAYLGIPEGSAGTESIPCYEEAAADLGLIPCFFRITDIALDTRTVLAWTPGHSGYVQTTVPLPKVIHNRSILQRPTHKKIIEHLITSGIYVFNAYNRYGKDLVHHMLAEQPETLSLLPHTAPARPSSIALMLKKHRDVIVKPCSGSVGLGIMRLQRGRQHDRFTYSTSSPSAAAWRSAPARHGRLPALLRRRISRQPFLVQERIPLARYGGNPYDIRITVQRGAQGTWEVTGMFARTTPQGTFVSNIAQGGIPLPIEGVLRDSFPAIPACQLVERLEHFGLRIAAALSRHMLYAADFGIDAGLTSDGRLFFIECNGRDQRYGFQKAGMTEVWKETYRKPMAFARYLLKHRAWPEDDFR
ncbi:YheC/YheD family protein [Paenibacillus sp. F411]|uniref:YheC/YheD family endospore coat-associated protein n=1 Tax=Paenibacillus sp. F411 TaxID=2820239 RepID=UPI001AAF5862|nr:YheC/YheD family protein [Paenibacillus sp. F411]MBO2944004.1 YheC/YheD family protein [Paenibacillus sp. F411]